MKIKKINSNKIEGIIKHLKKINSVESLKIVKFLEHSLLHGETISRTCLKSGNIKLESSKSIKVDQSLVDQDTLLACEPKGGSMITLEQIEELLDRKLAPIKEAIEENRRAIERNHGQIEKFHGKF